MARRRKLEGIQTRTATDGTRRYRGTAYVHEQKLLGPWTSSEAEAIAWREERLDEARRGMAVTQRITFGVAVDRFVTGIESGAIRNRSGQRFKPSVVRAYKTDLEMIKELVGADTHLDMIKLRQADDILEQLRGKGRSDSWVRNKMAALRSMCRWAIPKGYMTVNPVVGLTMPITDERARERIASVEEVRLLIGTLDFPYRTMLALAAYAGMRFGEILALEWRNVDLRRPSISVEQAVDHTTGRLIPPKSKKAKRDIPICEPLMVILEDHRLSFNATGPLFPATGNARTPNARMSMSPASKKIKKRFTDANQEPLGMHEARHTFASILIDAGASPKAISTYMGHASIQITFDRYGHLMPGHEAEVLELMNSYLATGVEA